MSKNYRPIEKRKRRKAYLKRKKEAATKQRPAKK